MIIEKKNIRGDILGGVSAAIVTLPVALAYGVATGLGPVAGMYTAIILGFLAALFGGTGTQISTPTGAMTVVVAFVVAQEVNLAGSLEAAMPALLMIFVLTGIIQMVLGLLKLGMNIRYVPYSVVSGFMSGIGIIIIVLQIQDVTGVYDSGHKTIPAILGHLQYFLTHMNWHAVGTALITLLIIFAFLKINKRIPGSLVALIVVTLLSVAFDLDIRRLGMIDIEIEPIDLGIFGDLPESGTIGRIVVAAVSLSILGSINTLLTSVVADKMTRTEHNSNKELFGQGLGNFVASLVGGFPGSGATACTVANIQAGGRNKISGLISAVFLLIVLLFGMELVSHIPYAVLGGILVYIGYVLIDKETLKKMSTIPRADNIVMLTVLVLTVLWNLLYAVLIGLIFAAFYFMKKMADVVEVDTEKTKVDSLVEQVIQSFEDEGGFEQKVLIKSIRGPVFFGFSSRFLKSMREISTDVKAVIFDLSLVPYMDHSGLRTFLEVIQFLTEKKVNICFSSISASNLKLLEGFDIVPNLVNEQHIFESVEECIMWLKEPGHLENNFSSEDQLYIPPAFTPNGDGVNDDWVIKNIERFPQASVKIFNREKEVIFESIGYAEPWNGQFKNELLPPGEYTYSIALNDEEEKDRNGSVFLFR